jgi:hypothetical protein
MSAGDCSPAAADAREALASGCKSIGCLTSSSENPGAAFGRCYLPFDLAAASHVINETIIWLRPFRSGGCRGLIEARCPFDRGVNSGPIFRGVTAAASLKLESVAFQSFRHLQIPQRHAAAASLKPVDCDGLADRAGISSAASTPRPH